MTIQDALERAKSLSREKKLQGTPGEPRPRRSRRASEPLIFEPNSPDFDRLPEIRIDRIKGRQNNIVTMTESGGQTTPVDAAYRLLRSRIQQKLRANHWSKLAITSPTPGDGKTTTCLNLAFSIAREKQRTVVLLDLDMRNPSVAKYLGVEFPVTIDQYLSGKAAWMDCLFRTNVDGLVIGGCNANVQGASELLASNYLPSILDAIKAMCPSAIILIDTPPVCATDEALLIGPSTDSFLVVVSESKTPRDELSSAMLSLAEFHISGVIVNMSTEGIAAGYSAYY